MLKLLDTIRAESSRLKKIQLLREQTDNQLFKKLIRLTYDNRIKFYITPASVKITPGRLEGTISLHDASDALELLSNRKLTGSAAIQHLQSLLDALSSEDSVVLLRVIDGSLKLGCSLRSFVEAFGKSFIQKPKYMGAIPYSKKAVTKFFKNNDTAYSQLKLDGRFANVIITEDTVSLTSRAGLTNHFDNAFDQLLAIRAQLDHDVVLHGELLLEGYGDNRSAANGVINSLVAIGDKLANNIDTTKDMAKFYKSKKLTYAKALTLLRIVVWDYIPLDLYNGTSSTWDKPYDARLAKLTEVVKGLDNVELVDTRVVTNLAEATAHFQECLSKELEGTILKSTDALWKDGKPICQIKFKLAVEFDLKITGGNFGSAGTKNERWVSSITVASSCGKLLTSPAGINEDMMVYLTENMNKLAGKIVTVKCSGISKPLGSDIYSCMHPTFVELRADKTEADSLETALNIEAAAKGLKQYNINKE